MAKKRAFERDFRRRVAADPKLKARYGTCWDAIATAQKEQAAIAKQQRWYSFSGSPLLNAAGGIVRVPEQAKLPDSLRLPQYRGGGLELIMGLDCGPKPRPTRSRTSRCSRPGSPRRARTCPRTIRSSRPSSAAGAPRWPPRRGQRHQAGRLGGPGRAARGRLRGGGRVQGSADRPGPEAQSDRHAGAAARGPAQRRDLGQRGEGRPGDLRRLRPLAPARRDVQPADQRRRGEELPHERHHRAVQDHLLRALRPLGGVRRQAAVPAAGALEDPSRPGSTCRSRSISCPPTTSSAATRAAR